MLFNRMNYRRRGGRGRQIQQRNSSSPLFTHPSKILAGNSVISFKPPKLKTTAKIFTNPTSRHKVQVPALFNANEFVFESMQQAIATVDRLDSVPHPFGIQTALWANAQACFHYRRRATWSALLAGIANGARTRDQLLDAAGEHVANSNGNPHPRESTLAMIKHLNFGVGVGVMAHGDYAECWQHLLTTSCCIYQEHSQCWTPSDRRPCSSTPSAMLILPTSTRRGVTTESLLSLLTPTAPSAQSPSWSKGITDAKNLQDLDWPSKCQKDDKDGNDRSNWENQKSNNHNGKNWNRGNDGVKQKGRNANSYDQSGKRCGYEKCQGPNSPLHK